MRHGLARRVVLAVYGIFALALIPWTVHLTASLPSRHETAHWDILWAGFDVGLCVAGIATVVATMRGPRALSVFASITGTLLLCDVWFDLLTSNPGSERAWAISEAIFAEGPLALFSFAVAYRADVVCTAAQDYVAARRVKRAARSQASA